MCKRFGFVEEYQINRPCCRLGFQIGEVLTAGLDRGCVLAAFERVARPPPGKPLWRNWCDSHRGEIAGPPRRAISAHRRGSVHPLSWCVSSSRIAAAIAPACGPILACCPGRWRRRSPATPPCAKYHRQFRTVLMCTPRTAAISSAFRPSSVSRDAMGRAARIRHLCRCRNRRGCPMPQPNDLSRSLTALDQDSTLIAVVEMSLSSWLVGGIIPGVERHPAKKLEANETLLLSLLHRWREEAAKTGRAINRIAVAFEAGRDGFWLARWLRARGIEAHVLHATSITV